MAQRTVTQEGETTFGTDTPGQQGALHVKSGGVANKPSVLLLDAVSDAGVITTYGLWVDDTGDLRIVAVGTSTLAAAIPNQDGSGGVVGSQS